MTRRARDALAATVVLWQSLTYYALPSPTFAALTTTTTTEPAAAGGFGEHRLTDTNVQPARALPLEILLLPDSRKLEELHPYFQPIVREVLRRAWERGRIFPYLTSGRRPYELQACYYAQSRLQPGQRAPYQGFTVTVTREHNAGAVYVVAKCGAEMIRRTPEEWSKRITNALPRHSWHTQGFAADFAFRSSATAKDARYDEWMYHELAALFREVCPAVRWGNDWDGDGVETRKDRDEGSLADLPHFEYHPGRTLQQVVLGVLPPFPKQCPTCRSFSASFVNEKCEGCAS